jgi:hypothetical protein
MFTYILQHKIAAGALTVLILVGIWYGLTSSTAPAPILQTDNAVSASDQDLVATLLTLRAVTLSGTIFSDPVFMSLHDFGVQIQPEPVGRDNPFAPLSRLPASQTARGANIQFAPAQK